MRGQHLHVDSNYFAERESVTTSTIDQGEVYAANMWRLASTTDVFNLGSIVPASSVALGFMYLKTNRSDIADAFIHGMLLQHFLVFEAQSMYCARYSNLKFKLSSLQMKT